MPIDEVVKAVEIVKIVEALTTVHRGGSAI
jgi:hypothetical protein